MNDADHGVRRGGRDRHAAGLGRAATLAAGGLCLGLALALAGPAGAQQRPSSVSPVERCDLFRELGRTLPPECQAPGMAPAPATGGVQTRGRIVIGRPDQATPRTGQAASTPTRPPVATPGLPPPATTGMAPPEPARTVGLLITFALGSAALSAEAQDLLDTVAEVIIANPSDRFVIEGHTDARGSDALNLALSERRALAARDYLVGRHGIAAGRLEARGYGRARPIIAADPFDGRNRRVQVGNLGS